MEKFIPYVDLLATLSLLAVTFWYAKTTRNMASSAKQSATESAKATAAAERSAEAALDAASVAQSQISPEFEGRKITLMPSSSSDHVECIRIDSTGDAVVVQRVRIRRAFRRSYKPGTGVPAAQDVELTVAGLDSSLPKRMHRGEHLMLTHPCLQTEGDDPFKRFILDIEYTFSESGRSGSTKELFIDVTSHQRGGTHHETPPEPSS